MFVSAVLFAAAQQAAPAPSRTPARYRSIQTSGQLVTGDTGTGLPGPRSQGPRGPRTPLSASRTSPSSAPPVLLPGFIGEDCNGNGILDSIDIAFGNSADCQSDGIPDECQLQQPFVYRIDDGGQNGAVGSDEAHIGWWNQFLIEAGHETVTELEIAWGLIAPSSPGTIGLWSDPNGDGNPIDAQPLVLVPTVSAFEFTGTRVRVDIPDTFVGPAGTSYFVGAYGAFGGSSGYPASYDNTLPDFVSWAVTGPNPIQPDDLPAAGEVVRIDEVCCSVDWILRAIVCPTGHCGESADLDVNGIPDECQLADCNGNGIEDVFDIANATSLDCQGDGIPDECQLAEEFVYAVDDGSPEIALGAGVPFIGWLNRMTVQPGAETVSELQIAWGALTPGTLATVGLWSDPDGDGDPTDANLLVSVPTASSLELTGTFVRIDIPDTFIGPSGTSFFVGAYGEFALDAFPALVDQSAPDLGSWYITSATAIDPTDLDAGAIDYFGPVGLFPGCAACGGDFLLRVSTCTTGHCSESPDLNMNGVPDACDPDCNGNGIPDDVDILQGNVTDCDMDGTPDSCQELEDCDGNGMADLCQTQVSQGLVGSYYSNRELEGTPMVRFDPNVFFNFDLDPAFPGLLPTDNFSVRWTGAITTGPAGTYTFELFRDDGVRLWVNGVRIIDLWESGVGTVSGTIDLAANTDYYFVLEYYEEGGDAACELSWQVPGGTMTPVMSTDLKPLYDRNMDGISDTCQVTDCNGNGVEDAEDIAFGTSRDCEPNGIPDECQPCDDCDGNGVPDGCELAVPNGVLGQYFLKEGNPVVFTDRVQIRFDPNIDFDWAGSTPFSALGNDDFGIRWTGTLTTTPTAGTYEFHVQSDDGVRFWLDDTLIVDEWHPSSGNEYTVSLDLGASTKHLLRLDYYEDGGDARIFLRWTPPGGVKVPVPMSALEPNTDLNGDGVPDLSLADCNFNGIPDPLELDANANCITDDCETGTAYWRFEEGGGTTASDSTANGLDGTLTAGPTRVVDVPVATVPRTGAANTQALDLGWQNPSSSGYVVVPDPMGRFSVADDSFTLEGWIRLSEVSTTGSVDERQWLFMKKPAGGADTQLEFALLAQAGNLGGSGRELQFRYGDGTSVQGITSSLSISDNDWHFVSVAYDHRLKLLRFGLDGAYDLHNFEKPSLAGPGRLTIGAHENTSGVQNQFLRGWIDEIRFSRTYLPIELLLDAP